MVGIPVILLSVWYGGLPLSVVILIIAVVGIIEMCRLWNRMDIHAWLPGALAGGFGFIISTYYEDRYLFEFALFLTLAAGIIYLISVYPSFTFTDLSATVFTPIYAGWFLAHIIYLRQLPDGFHFVFLVLAATWCTDTFAYFVGINIGRHKLAPVLSPNKSVEGALGGVAGSVAVSLVIGIITHRIPVIHYIVLGLLTGIIGQVGDLLESAVKRSAGVKDSGRLIPGHGGMLDRFDSLYLTAPMVYYYIRLFITN